MAKYISPIDKELAKRIQPLIRTLNRYENQLDKIIHSTVMRPKRTAEYWSAINKKVDKIYNKMDVAYSSWTKANLPKSYRDSVYTSMRKMKKPANAYNKVPRKTATELISGQYSKNAVSALTADAIRDFQLASSLGEKNVSRYLSSAQKTTNELWLAGENITGGNMLTSMSKTPAGKKLVKTMSNSRFVQIVDKNGKTRNYTNKYYAEMVHRVKWHEAQSAAVRGVAANYNTDLIRVSAHNTTTEICQQYEGKVMSISGKSKEFPVADQVPPYHVNCLHFITPIFIETLQATGTEQAFIDFGKGTTNKPPFPSSYVPVSDRTAA